jgi:hypothetical protein
VGDGDVYVAGHRRHAQEGSVNHVIRRGKLIEVETLGVSAPTKRRRRQDFIITTRGQSDRLDTAHHLATAKVFRHLQFLAFKSRGKPVRLANVALARGDVGRRAKRLALRELEDMGLIRVMRCQHHSPEVVILDLPEEPDRNTHD